MENPASAPNARTFGPTHWILVAIAAGTLLGLAEKVAFPAAPFSGALGQIALHIIRFIKGLAIPLVFFAVLNTLVRTPIDGRTGIRFLSICAFNAMVAATLGITLLGFFQGGSEFSQSLQTLIEQHQGHATLATPLLKKTITAPEIAATLLPQNLIDPIQTNNLLATVVLALLVGASVRSLNASAGADHSKVMASVNLAIEGAYLIASRMLQISVRIVPVAVFGLISQAVNKLGLDAFSALGPFLLIILAGLLLQGLIYYPLAARLFSGRRALGFLSGAKDAAIMAFAVNSSLATVPVTLRCLSRMNVSEASAHVSVLGGSNFNNDGIVLYEVMAALFLATALGIHLDLTQQALIALTSILAAMGIAGVPEAGLVILPIVLGNSGFSEAVIAAVIPLVTPVDWIIGRCRSLVNVLGDMLGACLLDHWDKRSH